MMKNYKQDFAIYDHQPDLIYLDSGATSLTPRTVVDTIYNYYSYERSTINRGASKLVNYNNDRYLETRTHVASMLNCSAKEVIFGQSTTDLMNHIARNIIDSLNPGDEIIISPLEHHSTLLSFRERAKEKGIKVTYALLKDLQVDLDATEKLITNKTKVIVMHHISNVIGDKIDLYKLGEIAKKYNLISVVDGAQGFLHECVDVKILGIDFYVFSAHKVFGPTGLGIMYGNENLIKDYFFDYGGDMASSVDVNGFVPKPLPQRLEAGTPPIAEVIAFNQALNYIESIGINEIDTYCKDLANYAKEQLLKLDMVEVYNKDIDTTMVVFNIIGAPVHDAQEIYAKHNISIRSGQMCNALSVEQLGVSNVLRISIGIYNTKADIDKFIEVTKLIIDDPLAWM